MKSLEAPYSAREIVEALGILHPAAATLALRRLHTNRLDAEERAAMAEVASLTEAVKGHAGEGWVQRRLDAAKHRADRAAAATAAYLRDAADPRKTIW